MVSLKIFVIHSMSPKNMELIKSLEQQIPESIELYVAGRDKKPGLELKHKIKENLKSSDIILALLTKGGEHNDWVHQEIGSANMANIPIIPVKEKGVKVKGFTEGLEWIPLNNKSKDDTINAIKKELISRYESKIENIREKEAEEFRNMMIVALGLIAVVIIVAIVASRK